MARLQHPQAYIYRLSSSFFFNKPPRLCRWTMSVQTPLRNSLAWLTTSSVLGHLTRYSSSHRTLRTQVQTSRTYRTPEALFHPRLPCPSPQHQIKLKSTQNMKSSDIRQRNPPKGKENWLASGPLPESTSSSEFQSTVCSQFFNLVRIRHPARGCPDIQDPSLSLEFKTHACRSRWLVGSSSSRRSGSTKSARASATRMRHPPAREGAPGQNPTRGFQGFRFKGLGLGV